MKVNKVSALRSKRGLHRVNGAEPQVVGLTPQTTMKRKANTMKTYILRQTKPVEPQKSIRPPRGAGTTTANATCRRQGRSSKWVKKAWVGRRSLPDVRAARDDGGGVAVAGERMRLAGVEVVSLECDATETGWRGGLGLQTKWQQYSKQRG